MLRRILVPDQNADNLFKAYQTDSGCCGSGLSACKYTVSFTNTDTVTGITIKDTDGTTNKALTFTGVTGVVNIVNAIRAALVLAGYEDDNQNGIGVSAVDSGGNITVTIIGEAVAVSIADTGGPTNFAAGKCTLVGKCNFFFAWPGNASSVVFRINGVNATLAAQTLAGKTAAEVKTALEALANWPANTTTTVVETATAFEITLNSISTNQFTLDGNDFVRSNCVQDYI